MSRRRMRFSNNELLGNIQNLPDEMILEVINKLPMYNRIQLAMDLDRPGLIPYNCDDYKKDNIEWFKWILNNKGKIRETTMTNKDFILLNRDLSPFFSSF